MRGKKTREREGGGGSGRVARSGVYGKCGYVNGASADTADKDVG